MTRPELFPAAPLEDRPGSARSRWLNKPRGGGWEGVVLSEWELTASSWTDKHLHDEFNFVIEGQLTVECDGVEVVASAGDVVKVPAGTAGRYTATRYARMLAIYAPNPTGESPTEMSFTELPPP